MKNNVYKIILITMITLVSMVIAASANTATIDGTYNEGVVTINVSGVGINDEVFLLAVPANQELSSIESSSSPKSLVKYVEQKTADNGTATFTFASDTENIDVYSGYSSMGVSDTVLLKEFGSSLINAPTVDTTKTKMYDKAFNLDGFKRIFVKLDTADTGLWMPAHNGEGSTIYYSTEREGYDGLIKSTAADITTALSELSWTNIAPTAEQTIAMYGDFTGDGKINLLDTIQLKTIIKNKQSGIIDSNLNYLISDVSNDGNTNLLDTIEIKTYIKAVQSGTTYEFTAINDK